MTSTYNFPFSISLFFIKNVQWLRNLLNDLLTCLEIGEAGIRNASTRPTSCFTKPRFAGRSAIDVIVVAVDNVSCTSLSMMRFFVVLAMTGISTFVSVVSCCSCSTAKATRRFAVASSWSVFSITICSWGEETQCTLRRAVHKMRTGSRTQFCNATFYVNRRIV